MTRALDLFSRLRDGECSALDELIADREPESLFLDFKRSPNDGAARQLAPEDNKNLSKAISGFANSSGGVVVWGVDCRRDNATGNEVADKHPLLDAGGFNTKLQSAISRTTIPPHPGIQVVSFDEPGRAPVGYVAVLVPQSVIGPIRSVVTNHYHIRTGSDFGIVPHDVLAGMFGRAPQPNADLNVMSYPARLDSRPGHLTIALGLIAVNLGSVVGERPYLSAFFGDFPQNLLTVQTPDRQSFSVRRSPIPTWSVVASQGVVLAPGATEHLCDIVMDVPIDRPRAISLECTLGVLGAPPKRFTLSASQEAVREGIARAQRGSLPSSDIVQLLPGG
ncbi:MAG: hypothetical protein A3H91_10295 [Gammaproteobacteria bacterium RIFCSPLOWO2_02_FULL_61_13]|nr:MAG: hypothetical protein A3H91_10295 [Gammaproteobacteria bacterium RIFCSPLOWO2_02_FULL_61_13]